MNTFLSREEQNQSTKKTASGNLECGFDVIPLLKKVSLLKYSLRTKLKRGLRTADSTTVVGPELFRIATTQSKVA